MTSIKYMKEFEDNVHPHHMDMVRSAVKTIFEKDELDTYTSASSRELACVAEYGLRFLMDIMVDDKESTNESKRLAVATIRKDLVEIRARIDDVLDRVEKELEVNQ